MCMCVTESAAWWVLGEAELPTLFFYFVPPKDFCQKRMKIIICDRSLI